MSTGFGVALVCSLAMGFAIQRGATCTVVAVAEVVHERRISRLAAMIEASLWVLGGLLVAQAIGLLPAMPPGFPITAGTITGGALLGVGAYVNRACVFGAIARLGSGEWAYFATPIGFYAGCVVFGALPLMSTPALTGGSPVLSIPTSIALPFAALLLVRPLSTLHGSRHSRPADARVASPTRSDIGARIWSAHNATVVIGIAFVVMFVLAGAWSYTDALADLARAMTHDAVARTTLFAGLLAGAVLGGWTAGRFRNVRITASQIVRCFAGGALMALGTLLVPGSNDGLILIGMPLLWPYAWLAFATMCVSIGAALVVEKARVSRSLHPPGRAAPREPSA